MSKETPSAATTPEEGKTSKQPDIGGYISWGDVGVKPGNPAQSNSSGGDRKNLTYLTLEEGKPYRIRLIDKPFKFYRHYEIVRAISPGYENDVCWQAGHNPRERYTVLLLDRNDDNKMKILEGGPLIFKSFKSYYELSGGKNPGGKEGPDWLISVKIPVTTKDGHKFKDKRKTEYNVMPDTPKPFTDVEVAYIKENWVELPSICKPTSPEFLKEMFEDAKKRSDSDPIPGTKEWWKARRDKKGNGKGSSGYSDDTPIVPPSEPETKDESKVENKDAKSGDSGFGGLFDDGDKAPKKATQF